MTVQYLARVGYFPPPPKQAHAFMSVLFGQCGTDVGIYFNKHDISAAMCHIVTGLHLAWAEVCFSSFPTTRLGHADMRTLFGLCGTDVEMLCCILMQYFQFQFYGMEIKLNFKFKFQNIIMELTWGLMY